MTKAMGFRATTVSVVIPSFQQGPFIRNCIESILSQEEVNVEVILFDSCSTDETVRILKEYSDRVKIVVEEDLGQGHAINKGLSQCSGEIIGYLNSDDVLLPGCLRGVADFFELNKSTDLLYGKAHYIDEGGNLIGDYLTWDWDWDAFQGECFICQPAAFWRRRIMEKVGLLDQRLRCSMDYDYWLRIIQSGGKVAYLDEYLACSRDYPETKTRSLRGLVFWENFGIQLKRLGFVHHNWIEGYFHYLKYEKKIPFKELIPSPGGLRSKVCLLLSWVSRLYSKDVRWDDYWEDPIL